jgi:alpha-ribazole phosphatase
MEQLILARHGESVFSSRLLVNGDIASPGPLTPRGRAEARALGQALAAQRIDLCATSEFERTRETADVALAGRDVPRLVLAALNDPLYGS